MKTTYLAVNANSGAYKDVACSIPCRKMVIAECRKSDGSAYAPQGLRYKLPDDGFTAVHYGVPGDSIVFGNDVTAGDNKGVILGWPAQNLPAAAAAWAIGTTYAKGAFVLDDGFLYVSLEDANTGNKPVENKDKWALVQNYRPADVLCKILSDSATATQVELTETE